jgi:hypothetical protein
MFSIRKAQLALVVFAAGMLGGCQLLEHPQPLTAVSTTPIRTDQAMATRRWDISVAGYPNDAVVSQHNYQPLMVPPISYKGSAVAEPLVFVANILYMPVGVFIDVPRSRTLSKSLALPPSYTLMPPLPNGPEPVPTLY